jgi:protein TonB
MSPPGLSISARRLQGLLRPGPTPANRSLEPVGIGAGRRTLAIGLALLITGGLLLLLLTFGLGERSVSKEERVTLVTLEPAGHSEASPEQGRERQPAEEQPAPPRPEAIEQPPPPVAAPQAAPPPPLPSEQPPAQPVPQAVLRPSDGRVYGPPNIGGSASRDTERVGTAPNGEPLYAATWYREPSDDELRGYLSTASGPGWGLIACRTAPDYRVEDCVGLDEYPYGSQINRAVLAAAWQFRVRPPRRSGRLLVGSWVRIRIDYGVGRRSGSAR